MKALSRAFLALLISETLSNYSFVHADSDTNHHHNLHNESSLRQQRDLEQERRFLAIAEARMKYSNFESWARSSDFRITGARCQTQVPSNTKMTLSQDVLRKFEEAHPCTDTGVVSNPECPISSNQQKQTRNIRVFWHVITSGSSGNIPDSRIQQSINILNSSFNGWFTFSLQTADIDRTNNSNWYGGGSEMSMKNALHRGTCGDLNVYSSSPSGGILGYAYFPDGCKNDLKRDGVVVLDESLSGGNAAPYNSGDTLVHEVGHWLGLYHTFEGGCSSLGDRIADTPAEAEPGYGCPRTRDSCPGGGTDPVTNFMDYSDDSCMETFTQNQFTRMVSQWESYRSNGSPTPPTAPPPTPPPNPLPTPPPNPLPTPRPTSPPTPPPNPLPTPPTGTGSCNSGEGLIEINIRTDRWGKDTSWMLINQCSNIIQLEKTGPPYGNFRDITIEECIPDDAYTFEITDAYGDGLCCKEGNGSYNVRWKGAQVASGGRFGEAEATSFGSCGGGPAPTPPPAGGSQCGDYFSRGSCKNDSSRCCKWKRGKCKTKKKKQGCSGDSSGGNNGGDSANCGRYSQVWGCWLDDSSCCWWNQGQCRNFCKADDEPTSKCSNKDFTSRKKCERLNGCCWKRWSFQCQSC